MKRNIIYIFTLLIFSLLLAQTSQIESLSAEDFKLKLTQLETSETDFVLLDLRTQPEFESGHLAGALILDFYAQDFTAKLNELDKSKLYLIYCRSGNRSGRALQIMQELGFENVIDLENGIIDWLEAGYEVVK